MKLAHRSRKMLDTGTACRDMVATLEERMKQASRGVNASNLTLKEATNESQVPALD